MTGQEDQAAVETSASDVVAAAEEAVAVVSNASDQLAGLTGTLGRLETSLDRLADSNSTPSRLVRVPIVTLLTIVMLLQVGMFVFGYQIRESVRANRQMIACVLLSPEGQPARPLNECVR